jgi:hypothetical protein
MPAPRSVWLELLLRQHEACWTADDPHDELRVFFIGNSSVQGHPQRIADTATEHLTSLWKQAGVPARAFNFGFVTGHAMKDMLILHEALRYRPDVIVYGVFPGDFRRWMATWAPTGKRGPYDLLVRFMYNSASVLRAFAAERPAGLERPLAIYNQALEGVDRSWLRPWTWPWRDLVGFVHTALVTRLRAVGERLGVVEPPGEPTSGKPIVSYSCRETRRTNARDYRGWNETNTLAWVAELRDRTGIPVVVVNWPVSDEPRDECFNAYFTQRLMRRYREWLVGETERLRLPLVDLSRTLLPRDYLDTLHPNARGQRKIAGSLAPHLAPILRQRAAEVLSAAPH